MNESSFINKSFPSENLYNASDNTANQSVNQSVATPPNSEPLFLILLVLPVITVFGNVLVVIAIGSNKKLRTITNQMILSLAVSDLLMGLLTMPVAITDLVLRYWPFGEAVCHLWHSIDVFASTASILNLCVISLDRYWAVTNPIAYPRLMSRKRGLVCISCVWICSLAISFPVVAWWDRVDPYTHNKCVFTEDSVYLLISSMISFYIPVFIMIIVYSKILLVIREKNKRYSVTSYRKNGRRLSEMFLRVHRGGSDKKSLSSSYQPVDRSISSCSQYNRPDGKGATQNKDEDLSCLVRKTTTDSMMTAPVVQKGSLNDDSVKSYSLPNSDRAQKPKLSNEFRVARTLIIVLGVFLVCWLPFFVCNLVFAVCPNCPQNDVLFHTVTWLGYANSGVNPVIYALSMVTLRRAFLNILCFGKRKYANGDSVYSLRALVLTGVGSQV